MAEARSATRHRREDRDFRLAVQHRVEPVKVADVAPVEEYADVWHEFPGVVQYMVLQARALLDERAEERVEAMLRRRSELLRRP